VHQYHMGSVRFGSVHLVWYEEAQFQEKFENRRMTSSKFGVWLRWNGCCGECMQWHIIGVHTFNGCLRC
jgi:hypothetical protein